MSDIFFCLIDNLDAIRNKLRVCAHHAAHVADDEKSPFSSKRRQDYGVQAKELSIYAANTEIVTQLLRDGYEEKYLVDLYVDSIAQKPEPYAFNIKAPLTDIACNPYRFDKRVKALLNNTAIEIRDGVKDDEGNSPFSPGDMASLSLSYALIGEYYRGSFVGQQAVSENRSTFKSLVSIFSYWREASSFLQNEENKKQELSVLADHFEKTDFSPYFKKVVNQGSRLETNLAGWACNKYKAPLAKESLTFNLQ